MDKSLEIKELIFDLQAINKVLQEIHDSETINFLEERKKEITIRLNQLNQELIEYVKATI